MKTSDSKEAHSGSRLGKNDHDARMSFRLRLLGQVEVQSSNREPLLQERKKARAVLGILRLSPQQRTNRSHLAGLLWNDVSESHARASLRQCLRQVVDGLRQRSDQPILLENDSLCLPSHRWSSDLDWLEAEPSLELLSSCSHVNTDESELLADMTGLGEAFDEWLRHERTVFASKVYDWLDRALAVASAAPDFNAKIAACRTIVAKCPTNERAYQLLMQSLVEVGDRASALQVYAQCETALRKELDVRPSYQTRLVEGNIRLDSDNEGEHKFDRAGRPLIAVLPFAVPPSAADIEYFSDGFIEDIVTDLSRSKVIRVIARNTTFTYKGRSPAPSQIRRELGVHYLLQGNMRRIGSTWRVSAQLINTETEITVWADRLDAVAAQVFEVQDELVRRIVSSVAMCIQRTEMKRVDQAPSNCLAAYDIYLRGLHKWHQLSPTAISDALEDFEKALSLDDQFCTPAGLAASCYLMRKASHWSRDDEEFRAHTLKLITAVCGNGADDAVALAWAGHAAAYVVGDVELAEELVKKAVAIAPNFALARQRSGWVRTYMGDTATALSDLKISLRLNPLDPLNFLTYTAVSVAHFIAYEYEASIVWANRALERQPQWPPALRALAISLAHVGRQRDAKNVGSLVRRICNVSASDLVKHYPLRRQDDLRRLRAGLQMAGLD